MGTLVNFVSHTVVVGFTTGAAVLIAASQVRDFFGITIERGASVWQVLDAFVHQLGQINPYITTVAMVTVVSSVLVRRCVQVPPHDRGPAGRQPAGGAAQPPVRQCTHRHRRRRCTQHRPAAVVVSRLCSPKKTIRTLVPIAMAVALLALTEAVSISRAVALKSGQRIDGNQELVGRGSQTWQGRFSPGTPAVARSTAAA